jgi:hypothetical protein
MHEQQLDVRCGDVVSTGAGGCIWTQKLRTFRKSHLDALATDAQKAMASMANTRSKGMILRLAPKFLQSMAHWCFARRSGQNSSLQCPRARFRLAPGSHLSRKVNPFEHIHALLNA